ncbi:MAG: DUF1761 domain-containing protein [Thermoplasmatota archaeon]
MITYPQVNWLAVLVAGVALVVIGGLWYAPFLFGNAWMRATGMRDPKTLSAEERKAMQKKAMPGYALALVGSLFTAYIMSITVRFFGATTALDAIWVGSLMWVGFAAFNMIVGYYFEDRKMKGTLFLVNGGNQLVNALVVALIVTLWT